MMEILSRLGPLLAGQVTDTPFPAPPAGSPPPDGSSAPDPNPAPEADEAVESVISTIVAIWRDFLSHLPLLGAGVLVLLATWLAGTVFRRFSTKLLSRFSLRASLRELVARLAYIAIWVVGITVAAMIVFPGLTPARALAGLGLSSIAIGFAFKDIFENFFAGVLILWRFPFENGDFVECSGILGRVEDVTIRNTLLRKTTGELVVVPNATIFKNPVDVLTDWDVRRVTVVCGVAYGEDVDEARGVIEAAVRECPSVTSARPIEIFAREFGSSSIDFEVTWWTRPEPLDVRTSRDQVVAAVKRALDDSGIEIPFPYRTLTFKDAVDIRTHEPAPGS